MTLNDIAGRIPAEYRKEILETNMITTAIASVMDKKMHYLFTVWKNYVEPDSDLDMECGICVSRILDYYNQLLPTLIELEKQHRLLRSL